MQLNEFQQYLKLNTGSKDTVTSYHAQVKKFFNNKTEFSQETVNDYLVSRVDAGVAKNTLNQDIKALKQYAKFKKMIIEFPKIKTGNIKVRVYLTLKELEDNIFPMFTLLFDNYHKRELVLRFLFFTGLRLKEFVTLKRENIDLESRQVTICKTKSKRDRVIKFPTQLQEDIKVFFRIEPEQENAFNVSKSYLKWTLRKITKDLKYPKKLTPHVFRHSFAKHCLKMGMSIERVQILLGHSDLKTTMIYANPTQEEALEDYDKYIK